MDVGLKVLFLFAWQHNQYGLLLFTATYFWAIMREPLVQALAYNQAEGYSRGVNRPVAEEAFPKGRTFPAWYGVI